MPFHLADLQIIDANVFCPPVKGADIFESTYFKNGKTSYRFQSICDKQVSFVICSVVEYPLGEVYVVHGLLKAASRCLCWLFWTMDCM